MAMGRPPKPLEMKRALGNPGKRALPTPVITLPRIAQGAPSVPRGLKRPGRTAWVRLWSVGGAWLSPKTDIDLLTRLCQAYDERELLRGLVAEHGHLVAKLVEEDELRDEGNEPRLRRVYDIKANPAVTQLRKLEELITRYEGLCGFTPSDRSRLGMAEVSRVSKLDQLIQKQQERRSTE